ncbi:primase-helicase zinc-binding domain-containing protein [Aeromonas caviae]|uniref:primase-helicase zinc-binding domain-containing protein n=1 Tax=Aeromonas caviae TaxID=648 RepID=UPI003EC4FFC7
MTSIRIVSDVSLAARGQWPFILAELGLSVPKRGQHGPCPACGGKDRFRLDDKECIFRPIITPIPIQREHHFRTNVNAHSGST